MIAVDEARQRLRGVMMAVPTILRDGGRSLDLEATAANLQWVIDRGARQGNTILIAGGAAGEFPMMNLDERRRVIGTICRTAAGKLPVIAGVQSTNILETIELCQFCEQQGVVGVQMGGPYYYDGRPGDVTAWVEEVARHTQVGFIIYNNWYTGYDMPLDLIERLLAIPNSIGVKWSSPNTSVFYTGIHRLQPQAVVLDNGLWPVVPHMLGCRAFFSWLPPFYPERAWQVWELLEQGSYLEAQQAFDEFMVPLLELFGRVEARSGGQGLLTRTAMAAIGLPVGECRLPSRDEAIAPEIREDFRKLMVRFGVTA